jgi:hypothetical protein
MTTFVAKIIYCCDAAHLAWSHCCVLCAAGPCTGDHGSSEPHAVRPAPVAYQSRSQAPSSILTSLAYLWILRLMRSSDLGSLIQLNIFPTGRRLRALTSVHALIAGMGLDDLSTLLAEAIAHDEATYVLEQRWRAKRKTGKVSKKQARAKKEVVQIDIQTDNTLTALKESAESCTKGADREQDKELFDLVDTFLDEVLPGGVQAVSGKAFPEELLAVEAIVKKLQSDKLKPILQKLGAGVPAERLARLAVRYRAALEAAGETLDFGTVREARSEGQNYLSRIVVRILDKYGQSGGADAPARAKLLRPILEQDEQISAHFRARRSIPDIDPKTGEEQPVEADEEEEDETKEGGGE